MLPQSIAALPAKIETVRALYAVAEALGSVEVRAWAAALEARCPRKREATWKMLRTLYEKTDLTVLDIAQRGGLRSTTAVYLRAAKEGWVRSPFAPRSKSRTIETRAIARTYG